MAFYRKLRARFDEQPFCTAVIVAAGASTRMGRDKLLLELGGVPALVRAVRAFGSCGCVDEIVLVVQAGRIDEFAALREQYALGKVTKVVAGGETRAQSSLNGVLAADRRATLIAIHDGARPLVTPELIEATCALARVRQAAVPALPVKDTVKRAQGDQAVETLPRDALVTVQTPQVFRAELIRAALTSAVAQGLALTDDCSAVEAAGVPVALAPGSEENLKLTTPLDVELAELILRRRGA